MSIPFGYGDADGVGSGGYGAHQYGYGHPFSIIWLQVIGGPYRPDLGGELLTFDSGGTNNLPAGPFQVSIGGVGCYSGVSGSGTDIQPDATRRYFGAVLPHLFGTLGPVDVVLTHAGGVDTYAGAVHIVRYQARTSTTLLALRHPRDVYEAPIPVPRS